MLLLILFAGYLVSCAAQTTFSDSSTMVMPTTSTTPFTQPVQATPVLLTSDSTDNVVAILQAALQSNRELNETTIGPVLTQLSNMIQLLQPGLDFSLTVKNITRV